MTPDQIQALRKEFRERFCETDEFMRWKVLATPQMIEDFWLHEMGLMNND